MAYNTNIGPFQWEELLPGYGVPIGPYSGVVVIKETDVSVPGTGAVLIELEGVEPPVSEDLGTTVFPVTYRPEVPLVEHLLFRTKVNRKLSGVEERISRRKCPRIAFEWKIADGRQRMENLLFGQAMDYMGAIFWHEPAFVTTALLGGEDHVHVGATAYSQFLAGQWAIIISTTGYYDLLEVETVAANEITFTDIVTHDYAVGSEVLPVCRCVADSIVVSKQLNYAVYDIKVAVEAIDNDLGVIPYTEGELEITGVNYVNPLHESFSRPYYRRDAAGGKFSQTVVLSHADKGSMLGFRTHSRSELWALRQMLYRLGGMYTAFYLATFGEELTPIADLVIGQSTLTVDNCGYTDFVQSRRGSLRIHLADTTVLERTVVSSTEISSAVERLTVDSVWDATIPQEDIVRIEYLDLVRLDTDDVVIRHTNALGWASCEVPVAFVYPQEEELPPE